MPLQNFIGELRRLRLRELQILDALRPLDLDFLLWIRGLLHHPARERHCRREVLRWRRDVRVGARRSTASATAPTSASTASATTARTDPDVRVQLSHLVRQLLPRV